MSRSLARRALVAAAVSLAPLPLLAQKAETGAFVVRLGVDTMVVERFVRTPTRLEAWSLNRQPATVRRHYVLTLDRGAPSRLEYEGGRADGSQPPTKVVMTLGRDTTTVVLTRNGQDTTMSIATPGGAIPSVGNSFALTELVVARFLAGKADTATIATLPLGAPRVQPQAVKRVAPGTLHLDYFGAPWVVRLDAKGSIVAVDGSQSAGKVLVERVKDVDVAALEAEFVARDKAGRGFGVASRADSVRATVGSARLAINYSRPARRGRQLLGGLVPFDSVWRTGANAATVFTTSATLDIGGTTIPAGSYTLWTLPTRTGWQLVVNKQVGQWGTDYHKDQDFARIPMTVNAATGAGPELFTIAIEPKDAASATLRLTWGDIDVSVPVTVKQDSASR